MREHKYRAWYQGQMYFVAELEFDAAGVSFVALVNTAGEYTYEGKAGLPFELLEYTGLKDSKGQEIFEGNIIKTGPVKIERIGEPFIGRVYWFEREFQWWITDDTQDPIIGIDYDVTFLDNYQYFEVIGNIYEHPSLLEKEGTPL